MGGFTWNYGAKYAGDRHSLYFMYTPLNEMEQLSIGYMFSVNVVISIA